MKKALYNSAMNKVTMSDECLGAILDSIEDVNKTDEITAKPKKIRYINLITAVAVFILGTLSVAAIANYDWIKGFFKDDFEISEEIMGMSGEMLDFRCESNTGIKLSPVGVISTGNCLYCMFRADELPVGITTKDLLINYDGGLSFPSDVKDAVYGLMMNYNNVYYKNNIFGVRISTDCQNVFEDGKEIELSVCLNPENAGEKEKFIRNETTAISFRLRTGKTNVLNIDYSKYKCEDIPERDYSFLFSEMTVTPLSINAKGSGDFYADESLSSTLKAVMKDGTEIYPESQGYGIAYNNDVIKDLSSDHTLTREEKQKLFEENYHASTEWLFEQPVNPDNIEEIYLGDMRIFKKQ